MLYSVNMYIDMYAYTYIHAYIHLAKELFDFFGVGKTFFFFKLYIFFSANILLDEAFTAKISDFGLARASEKFAQTVMTSRIVGTTAYMAPEALRGEITPKSDIYSFGVVSSIYIISKNSHSAIIVEMK